MKSILFFALLTIALGCGKTTTEIGTHSGLVFPTLAVTVDSLDVTDGMITAFDAYYVVEVERGHERATITVKLAVPVPVGQLKLGDSVKIAVLEKREDIWTAVIHRDIEIPVLEPLPALP